MNAKLRREHDKLRRLWATGKATMRQMERCMVLDRLSSHNHFNHDYEKDARKCRECKNLDKFLVA